MFRPLRLAVILFAWFSCRLVHAQIDCPDEVADHAPIVARATETASIYLWEIREPAQRLLVADGQEIHIWAPPGRYTIKLTAISIDWESKHVAYREYRHALTVQGETPGPDPDPDPPDPLPKGRFGFAPVAVQAAREIAKPARAKWREVAENYEAVAAGIAAGSWRTPTEALTELSGRNQFTLREVREDWMPWALAWKEHADALNTPPEDRPAELRDFDQLRNLASDYADAFNETAVGLRALATSSPQ
jgi:hypothetical protein